VSAATEVRAALADVHDPEIPVVTIEDLGILRDVAVDGDRVVVTITPTYSGCPAMAEIEADVRRALAARGFSDVAVWAHRREAPDYLGALFRRSVASSAVVATGGVALLALLLPFRTAVLVVPGTLLLHVFRAGTGMHLACGAIARFNVERTALPAATTASILTAGALDLSGPVPGYLVGQLAAAILIAPAVWRHGLLKSDGAAPALTATIARHSVIGNVLNTSLARVDLLVVGFLADPAAVGIYSVALSVAEVALTGTYALAFHALREGATGQTVSARTMRRGVESALVLSAGAVAGLAVAAGPLLGRSFRDVWLTFALLVPGVVAIAVVRLRFSADLTAGRGRRGTIAFAMATFVMVCLDLALVPALAEHGAAAASSLAYLVAMAVIGTSASQETRRGGNEHPLCHHTP